MDQEYGVHKAGLLPLQAFQWLAAVELVHIADIGHVDGRQGVLIQVPQTLIEGSGAKKEAAMHDSALL